ncbi:CRISPR-associated endoribonuclease Cas6 [Geoglobus ahangari]|uniref:CRISPR-associated endoribonuclease n=1 Tax=Geoglobus ahangari TaxID=113653 RepID=A0A0F7IG81_9EURY|nr:CRISPR-associated endoribonuclease Cas6 [Geoglobus ahangari]AKG92215.1 CRISPR-associated endoribonuclease Cas6 [Geoglobus ahangari]
MRIKIGLTAREKNFTIDLNYNYHLASAIYRAIERANPTLSLELHSPSRPKLFTFSRLLVPGRKFRISGERMHVFGEELAFFFSTPRTDVAEAFVEGILSKPEFRISGVDFVVSEVRIVPEREIGSKARFITLSPINVSTVESKNGRKRILDLYPDDERFYAILQQNLVKKYIEFYRRTPENVELEIKPLNVKAKRIRIKNTFHRCVEMVFEAKGSKELLEMGYWAGFGGKNSMGLGMVKVV